MENGDAIFIDLEKFAVFLFALQGAFIRLLALADVTMYPQESDDISRFVQNRVVGTLDGDEPAVFGFIGDFPGNDPLYREESPRTFDIVLPAQRLISKFSVFAQWHRTGCSRIFVQTPDWYTGSRPADRS